MATERARSPEPEGGNREPKRPRLVPPVPFAHQLDLVCVDWVESIKKSDARGAFKELENMRQFGRKFDEYVKTAEQTADAKEEPHEVPSISGKTPQH